MPFDETKPSDEDHGALNPFTRMSLGHDCPRGFFSKSFSSRWHDLTTTTSTAGKVENKNKLGVSAQEEPFMKNGAGQVRKLGLGGKKFSRKEVTYVDYSKNGKGADGETSKISGNDSGSLKKPSGSRDQKNDAQKLVITGPKQYLKSTKFVILSSIPPSTNPKSCSQDCKYNNLRSSSSPEQQISEEPTQSSTQKDETQRFSEAAKEIASLIYKDYKGKPSHRSPINNQEPKN
ncbi:unnamed protein product [Sphenostylis stenocarpa]|uniref:Uncharacterized protein n=1 Tax=Sphenostylis stenocarpa TaxID=92480 RepID=A0AA86V5W6_9FABA|nr:unnamed protein product [Sphenostylis stenocarpa]